jgi:hypothetical protein
MPKFTYLKKIQSNSIAKQETSDEVQIQNVQQIYKGFIQLDEATLQFEKFNGTMTELCGASMSIAVMPWRFCYLIRFAAVVILSAVPLSVFTVEPQNAWPFEVVAGSVESNDGLLETAIREVEEEADFASPAINWWLSADATQAPRYIGTHFPLCGRRSERHARQRRGGLTQKKKISRSSSSRNRKFIGGSSTTNFVMPKPCSACIGILAGSQTALRFEGGSLDREV